jgi:hypothetical protein
MSNLVHLDRSIGRFASRSRRLRFLYSYLGGKPTPREARLLVRRLLQEKRRLDRRNHSAIAASRVTLETVNPMRAATGKLQYRSRY